LKKILFIVFTLYAFVSSAQDSAFRQKSTIDGDFIDFTVDNLGNYYLLSKNNQLKKLNADGDSAGVFNDVRRYGKLYSIDATNPLKILLYYKIYLLSR